MQTFLPYPNFCQSAKCLDWRRLGKQRLEAKQILRRLFKIVVDNYSHHPAVLMWDGYEFSLGAYALCVCDEWSSRGYVDNTAKEIMELFRFHINPNEQYCPPPWFGLPAFHSMHRSVLLAKAPTHYSQFGWEEAPAVRNSRGKFDYIWPRNS